MNPVNTFNIVHLGFADEFNIGLRLALLFVLGAISALTLQKKFYQMTLFLFGVWLTFFRLTLLRSILLYVGIFNPEETTISISQNIYNFFQSSDISNVTSGIAFLGAILLFFWIKNVYQDDMKNLTKTVKTHQKMKGNRV